MKSEILNGTIWEEWEIDESWLVFFMETDKHGVLNIYCIPKEYK